MAPAGKRGFGTRENDLKSSVALCVNYCPSTSPYFEDHAQNLVDENWEKIERKLGKSTVMPVFKGQYEYSNKFNDKFE